MISKFATPILHALNPETAHNITIASLKSGILTRKAPKPVSDLSFTLFGRVFPNPVGLAAGFDKNAEVIDSMLGYGFGFVEAGTVTPQPQYGNPKPRLFRDKKSRHIINRMGFNGGGLEVFTRNVSRTREGGLTGPLGINIGANRDSADFTEDYVLCLKRLAPLADYVTLNLSSPNTSGLRSLQEGEALRRLLGEVSNTIAGMEKSLPLLLKLAPELEGAALAESVRAAMEFGIAGLILCNTTTARPANLRSPARNEQGGLSGAPLCTPALGMMREVYGLSEGRIPLVGVGGIASPEDAYARIRAGASLLQVYTGFIYRGPRLIADITSGLAERLKADGFDHIGQAVGRDP